MITRPSITPNPKLFFQDYCLYLCPVRNEMSLALIDIHGDYWTGLAWDNGHMGVVWTVAYIDERKQVGTGDVFALHTVLSQVLSTGGYIEVVGSKESYFNEVGEFMHTNSSASNPASPKVPLKMETTNAPDWWKKGTEGYKTLRSKWEDVFNRSVGTEYGGVPNGHALSVRAAQLRHKKRLLAIRRKHRKRVLGDA